MLKRTTSTHVIKVYEKFIMDFPTPFSIINSDKKSVVKYLKTLGLQNQRYRQLFNICMVLEREYGGLVPEESEKLINIKGIGEYIANSVLCFGAGQRLPIIDSNVERVIGRVFGVSNKKDLKDKATHLLPHIHYKEYNYGLLDLGALVCRPQNPKCKECPINICD